MPLITPVRKASIFSKALPITLSSTPVSPSTSTVWIASSRSPAETVPSRAWPGEAVAGTKSIGVTVLTQPPVRQSFSRARASPVEVRAERLLDGLAPGGAEQIADREVAERAIQLEGRRLVEEHLVRGRTQAVPRSRSPRRSAQLASSAERTHDEVERVEPGDRRVPRPSSGSDPRAGSRSGRSRRSRTRRCRRCRSSRIDELVRHRGGAGRRAVRAHRAGPSLNPTWNAPTRSNPEPWPPGTNWSIPTGSLTLVIAIRPARTSPSLNRNVAASPRAARPVHAPAKQSACCSVMIVGSARSSAPLRSWMA